jgi:hypothetical protein
LFLGIVSQAQTQFEWKNNQTTALSTNTYLMILLNAILYLKNGLTVILSPTNKDPRIQAYVAVKAGVKLIQYSYWFSTLSRTHAFKGTDKYGTLDWGKEKSN